MKTTKLICIVLLLLLNNLKIVAQDAKIENSVIWKIEGKELQQPSYVLGTIHLMCESDFKIPEKVLNALKNVDQLVMETNMTDPNEVAQLQNAAMGKEKLSVQLSKKNLEKLSSFLESKLGLTLAQVDQYSLTSVYSLSILQGLPCPTKKMYEVELMALAAQSKKQVLGLETVAQQAEYFEKSYPQDFLLQQLELYEDYKEIFASTIKLYGQENISEVYSLMTDKRFMDDNAVYWMLTYRNKQWVQKIPSLINKKSSLFAVGAGHLPGENGIINLLRKEGYTMTPVLN